MSSLLRYVDANARFPGDPPANRHSTQHILLVLGLTGPDAHGLIKMVEGVYPTPEIGYAELVQQHYRRSVPCYTLTLGDSVTEIVAHLQLEGLKAGLSSKVGNLLDLFTAWIERQPGALNVVVACGPGLQFEKSAVHAFAVYYLNPPWSTEALMACTRHVLPLISGPAIQHDF